MVDRALLLRRVVTHKRDPLRLAVFQEPVNWSDHRGHGQIADLL
jgi:hypothetical protein